MAKRKAKPSKRGIIEGRPPVAIDWGLFGDLCEMHCTLEELAGFFRCSPDTIERAVKEEHKIGFADYSRQKRGSGTASLRRAQMQGALAGNPTLLIWLGKQLLGQRDKQDVGLTDGNGGPVKLLVEFVDAK
jgi:hypothetical protein